MLAVNFNLYGMQCAFVELYYIILQFIIDSLCVKRIMQNKKKISMIFSNSDKELINQSQLVALDIQSSCRKH